VCQTFLFLVKTLAICTWQLEVLFHLTTTLCDNKDGRLSRMVTNLVEELMLTTSFSANEMGLVLVLEVQSWHIITTKFHDLLAHLTID
jgi:hypothetical protein